MQPNPVSRQDLQTSYYEVTKSNGLVELLHTLRAEKQKYSVKKRDVYTIFSNCPLWIEAKTGDGHVKFQHRLTGVVIGYQAHGGENMDPGGAEALKNRIQDHVNMLGNDIFGYTSSNWQAEPDYDQAAKRFRTWKPKGG